MVRAWGDESGSDRQADPGTYIFGAVVADGEAEVRARERMRALLLPGQRKVHWYEESNRRRDLIIGALAECGLDEIIVARVGSLDERDERRRRKCFEHFGYILTRAGVTSLELESRGTKADERDMEMVRALGAANVVPTWFRVSHAPGPSEPLLWAADAVCGAYAAFRTGNIRWWQYIEHNVRTETVSPPL